MSSNNEYLGKAANEASKTFIIKVISYVIAANIKEFDRK